MIRSYDKTDPARLVVYCRSYPLARGRVNKSKQVYQPLINQKEQVYYLKQYDPLNIDYPVFIEVTFGFLKVNQRLYPVSPVIGDLDNHIKGLLDNLQRTKHLTDDRFVVGIKAIKTWSTSNHIDIKLWKATEDDKFLSQ